MLEHQQSVLERVSDNEHLFRKEIIKSFKWLKSYEILKLHLWLKKNYGLSHKEIIDDIFQYIAA